MSTEVEVDELPLCDICQKKLASYDGRVTDITAWAYMCDDCWSLFGIGRLGTGYGQRLVLRERNTDA